MSEVMSVASKNAVSNITTKNAVSNIESKNAVNSIASKKVTGVNYSAKQNAMPPKDRVMVKYNMESTQERKYLTSGEYQALRSIFAAVSELATHETAIKSRARFVKNGWRDFRQCTTTLVRLMERIMNTIPLDKIRTIQRELDNTQLLIKVNAAPIKVDDGITYIGVKDLEKLVQKACENECMLCEKDKAGVRHCEMRKCLENTYHFGLKQKDICPFNGLTTYNPSEWTVD